MYLSRGQSPQPNPLGVDQRKQAFTGAALVRVARRGQETELCVIPSTLVSRPFVCEEHPHISCRELKK